MILSFCKDKQSNEELKMEIMILKATKNDN
jgi:hypothetical protein